MKAVSFAPQGKPQFTSQSKPYTKGETITFKVGCNAYVNAIDAAAEHRETGLAIRVFKRDAEGNRSEITGSSQAQELINSVLFLAPKPQFIELEEQA